MAQDAYKMPDTNSEDLPSPALYPPKPCGRLSTFNEYPQNLFPSGWNNLASDLETPYAFSHPLGLFYWTRDDALNDVSWNIWSNPPCLNCVVKGEVKAKSCDRMRRQEHSFGLQRCCTNCQQAGLEDSCIEMIERRTDRDKESGEATDDAELHFPLQHKNGHETVGIYDEEHGRSAKNFVDDTVWIESEKNLRKRGFVIWKPINVHIGDVEAKVEIVDKFERGAGQGLSHSTLTENPARFLRSFPDEDLEYDFRDIMKRRVAEWDQEADVEDMRVKLSAILMSSEALASPPLPIPEAGDAVSDVAVEAREPDLADVCEYWSFELTQAHADLYMLEVKNLGRTAAQQTAQRWLQDAEEVLPQVRRFLDYKMKAIVLFGMGLGEANQAASVTLTVKAMYWFQRLIPEMMTT